MADSLPPPFDPSNIDWDNVLSQVIPSNNAGKLFFPSAGKTVIKLFADGTVDLNGQPIPNFFRIVETVYQGRSKKKILLRGVVLKSDKGELGEAWKDKICYIVVTQTVVKVIFAMLSEGYDILEAPGTPIAITRTGQGLATEYHIIPAGKPYSKHPEDLIAPDMTLDEAVEYFREQQQKREESGANDGGRGKKKSSGKGGESGLGDDFEDDADY